MGLLLAGLTVSGLLVREAIPASPSDTDFSAHLQRLKKRVPSGFTVVEQRPFVVIGDEPAATVRRRATRTVGWAVERLKKDFFARDPEEIIDIWLFKDKTSYEKHTWELFQDRPTTPFGYYSTQHRALIMNIATGGGTLVHEIVHPFIRANFPQCPPWFNEGLASLYEQCRDKNGRITGLTNWRLPILQEAIRKGETVPFKKMCALTESQFYEKNYSSHYPQARYLCYYLQEHGLLIQYYKRFASRVRQDPTGFQTLQKVLGEDDMEDFQKRWEKFVLGLKFP